jgi:conjugal transfer pilus assembly protein TraW
MRRRRGAAGLLAWLLAAAAWGDPPARQDIDAWAREIAERHRQIALEAAGSRSGEAPDATAAAAVVAGQAAQAGRQVATQNPPGSTGTGKAPDGFWLFVSRSLGAAALREIFAAASRDGMTVVFRGIPEGARLADGLRDLQEMAASLDPPPGVILDPGKWREWQVDIAPTLILVEGGEPIARVSGMTDPAWMQGRIASGARGDLGVRGPAEPPSEQDLIAVLQERAAGLDFAALKQRAIERYWERATLYPLAPAEQDSRREIDLSVRVERHITTSSGAVVARAGQVIDPLASRPFGLRLVVFDATRPAEVGFASRQLAEHPDAVPIATAVERARGWEGLRELEDALGHPVYLLTPDVLARFDLRHTPSVVFAEGGRVWVAEHRLDTGEGAD